LRQKNSKKGNWRKRPLVPKLPIRSLRNDKPESNAMNGFQYYAWFGFQVFTQFTNEYIHAPAKKEIVFAPYINEHLFSFDHLVGMLTKEFKQVAFPLGDVKGFTGGAYFQIRKGKHDVAQRIAFDGIGMQFFSAPQKYFDLLQ
jgi:hypothetical protein